MTNGERKALAFLAGVGVLGMGARVALTPDRAPTRTERLALAGQIDAVDSARRAAHDPQGGATGGASRRRRGHATVDTVRQARATRSARLTASPTAIAVPAIVRVSPPGPVDVDVADSAALEALPGIGPGLARRIVTERLMHGAFGSLTALQQVRGVGPKLAARLVPYVTFSGPLRPLSAAVVRPP